MSRASLTLERSGFDFLVEALAFEKGHRDEGASVVLSNFVNRADVGVVQRGGCFGFAFETFSGFLVRDEMRGQELEGDGAVEGSVLCLVDKAHTALTELVGDAAVTDGGADHAGPILARKHRCCEQPIR